MNYLDYQVAEVGRRLIEEDSFAPLKYQLSAGEVLVGVYDRPIWKVCPVITNQEELDEFDGQYNTGLFVSRVFYAVKESNVQNQ